MSCLNIMLMLKKMKNIIFFDRICVPPIIIIILITFHMILVYFITQEKMEIRYFYDKNYFSDTFII